MAEDPAEESVTLVQAAALLGVSESTIRADLDAKRLPVIDRGKGRRPRWKVRRSDIDRQLAAGGRDDRRTVRTAPLADHGEDAKARDEELSSLRRQLSEAQATVQRLEMEVGRLRTVATNANVAVQAQTQSVQEYLIGEPG